MFSAILGVVSLICIALIVLGVSIYLRNTHAALNKLFFAFSICVATWMVVNYLSSVPSASHYFLLWTNRLLLIVGGAVIISLLAFLLQLASWFSRMRWFVYLFLASVLSWTVCLTPYVVSDIRIQGGQVVNVFGPLTWLYFGPLFLAVLATALVLIQANKRLSGPLKIQVRTISESLFIVIPIVIIGNAVLPLRGYYALASYTPLTLSLVVAAMAYAIIRHRLFDVRFFVVRALAYLTTVLIMTFVFITPYVLLLNHFFHAHLNNAAMALGILLSVGLLYLLQYLRKYFDRFTSKVFFRDAYDPQQFLDKLNRALVSNIELEKLLNTCAQIIVENLKSDYCLFGIKETDFKNIRIIGTVKRNFSMSDVAAARQMSTHLGTNVVITDFLPPEADKFHSLLIRNDVAALVRLVPEFASTKDGLEGLGYIILGQKRSGNMYNSQDVRMLGIIANELVIAIQNALRFEEIERFNVTLQEEIARATGKLRRANKRLEELDNTKDDFISMASHQLRTPLTSVKGYLSMVIEGDAGKVNSTQAKMLGQAFSSAQRMVFLITDLLNVSRLKTGKFVIEPVPVDLSKMVQEEVEQLAEAANGKQLTLGYEKPAKFPELTLDATKIRQVVMNFIDNAIYYTPAGGHIRIELEDKPHTVELRVIDDGIGVPKAEQHHLFTKFYRAANARQTRPDGTGLGLFMAQKVIVAQGGSIIFSSKEGQGSTFGFVFSKSRLKPADLAAPRSDNAPGTKAPAPNTSVVH